MDIFVTAETRELNNGQWEAVATAEQVYRVEADTEQAVQSAFVDMWNAAHGTDYTAENFDFVRQS